MFWLQARATSDLTVTVYFQIQYAEHSASKKCITVQIFTARTTNPPLMKFRGIYEKQLRDRLQTYSSFT